MIVIVIDALRIARKPDRLLWDQSRCEWLSEPCSQYSSLLRLQPRPLLPCHPEALVGFIGMRIKSPYVYAYNNAPTLGTD